MSQSKVEQEIVWAFDLARSVLGSDPTDEAVVTVATIALQRVDVEFEKDAFSKASESDSKWNPYSRGGSNG